MIRKPPGGRAVLWHQDHAYWEPELDYKALGVWLPMHDVSVEMGAMQFIPGSHKRGLLPHRHADKPEDNVLTVRQADRPDRGRGLPAEARRRDVPPLRDAALHRAEHDRPPAARLPDGVPDPAGAARGAARHAVGDGAPRRDGRGPQFMYPADGRFQSV